MKDSEQPMGVVWEQKFEEKRRSGDKVDIGNFAQKAIGICEAGVHPQLVFGRRKVHGNA